MPDTQTADLDTDLSLPKYDNRSQLPPADRDLDAERRERRIEAALDELGDDVISMGSLTHSADALDLSFLTGPTVD